MNKRESLRSMLTSGDILVMPSVYDCFSAKLVEAAGFKCASISGAGVSESHLGVPDVGVMGLTDNIDASRWIAASTSLPLLADGDTGYGNAVNVFYTVQRFEDAGLCGVMLEDQVAPKRCGHMEGKRVISTEEMLGKIRAAIDARRDTNFLIKARTDAATPLGIEEAIKRANLYLDAGADLVFGDALRSRDDIAQFTKEVDGPVCINMGFGIRSRSTTPLVSVSDLHEWGVAVVEYPRMLTAAAIRGMTNALEVLRDSVSKGTVIERPELLVSFEELNDLVGLPSIREMEQRYMPERQLYDMYGRG